MASLKMQILKRIDTLKMFGQSKHKAKKQEGQVDKMLGIQNNPLRVYGIYSKTTCDTYKKYCLDFATWERQRHPEKEFKILNNIPYDHIGEWLCEGISKGESGYTTRLKGAALAKLFQCNINAFGVKMPSKKGDRLKIKKSRNNVEFDKHFSVENNKDIINFCRVTGLRRSELRQLSPGQIKLNSKGEVIIDLKSKKSYRITTKGGRGRIVHPIKEGWNIVLESKNRAEELGQTLVFLKVHSAMDVHSYRREFALNKYKEVIKELKNHGKDIKLDYICRDGSGRRYNKEALRITSENLGHSRLDVVVKNYL
ncbi:hypothetical protein [Clostridium sp. HV4-5-A1G]|uniref:hypothetical protein n=1 Tax=Clostridium sp. HV4-5-A1G TaxID=2004595 RepID=UPI00123C4950|nr:hypothetical protein [Clostridium sp. HV4-5-A1G]KAA8673372.1 hypothetical protein F3O63_08755 [Clostridium sp. HV4-5-A1G]